MNRLQSDRLRSNRGFPDMASWGTRQMAHPLRTPQSAQGLYRARLGLTWHWFPYSHQLFKDNSEPSKLIGWQFWKIASEGKSLSKQAGGWLW
jgi:hypothetical protein